MFCKKINLRGRSLMTLEELTPEEILYIIDLAEDLKAKKKKGILMNTLLRGKNIALIFERKSTRTRCGFEVAAYDFGMGCTYLSPSGSQIGTKESIKDTARVLGRMYDGIVYRGVEHETLEELNKYAGVPVWNGLTDKSHPTPVLGALLTIKQYFGYLKGIKIAWIGGFGFDIFNSLIMACAKLGMHFVSVGFSQYFDDYCKDIRIKCEEICKQTGGSVFATSDIDEGTKNADVVFTDAWATDEELLAKDITPTIKKLKALSKYKITKEVMAKCKPNAIFLHCLPAFHNSKTGIGKIVKETIGLNEIEVSDEVFESPQSKVFDVSEDMYNCMKAVVYASLVD